MTRPVLSPLPAPPVRSDAPVDFSTKADAFLGAFPTLQSQINSATAWISSQVDTTASDVLASQAARTAAETARDQAQTARNEAVAANTGAQSAKTAAESANTAAQSAKTAAEAANTQAQQALTGAEDARDDAKHWAEQAEAIVLDPDLANLIASKAPLESPELTGTVKVNGAALGTAATRDATTSNTDTTSGRLLEVGDFGLGRSLAGVVGEPLSSGYHTIPGAQFVFGSDAPDDRPAGSTAAGKLANIGNPSWNTQVWCDAYATRIWVRTRTSAGADYRPWQELYHTGNTTPDSNGILHNGSTIPAGKESVTADDLAAALANIDTSGPRPTKDHGAVATVGSQTVICNVQESDFHMLDMSAADTTGTLTIDFANMPDTIGKHFSWHVRLRRGGRKTVSFAQTISWAGGISPLLGNGTDNYDLIMFYKVGNETIRGMVIDAI